MTFVDDFRTTFDAADFCDTVKAGVGEGRVTSNIALRDGAAVSAAVKYLKDFANIASAPVGPDVIAAYVTYSPGAPEIFTALRAISVNVELVSAALGCLECIVRYSLDGSKPQQPLELARSVVKEVVKSRAVLIYDILATDGKACAKKALNLLRLVATCHKMLVKELVNRFDLSAKSMAPSLCSVANNHCRVPFLDLMFVILASGERDVLHYLAGKGREVIVACLRTIQDRAILEASGGAGSSTKSILWKQGKVHLSKRKVLPSHVQKRELVAAINFLLATEKHLFVGLSKSSRGAISHPVPTILATLAATEIPPLDVAPREVLQEHETLRSTATRMFISIARDPRSSISGDIVKALNNPSFNFGTASVVKFISNVIQEKPDVAAPLLEAGRMLSAPPALTLRWFGYFSIVASCILRLSSPITTFREKQFFEKCLNHSDPLVRHLGSTLAVSFCKVLEKRMTTGQHAEDYLPALDIIQKTIKPGTNDDDVFHRLIASYQSLLQKHIAGSDVKLMTVSVAAAGEDMMAAAGTIEGALRTAPYSAVRKVVHKQYLSKLITKAAQAPRIHDALKLWRVCGTVLRCTDLFQPGTAAEIDVYLSVLSSLGKDAEEPAKAFEAMIAQALEMPYGLYDRLHSDEWSEESARVKTSQLSVATVIKLQKLAQKRSTKSGHESDRIFEETLQRVVLSIVATSSVLHREEKTNSYLTTVLPSVLHSTDVWWSKTGTEEDTEASCKSRRMVRKLLHDRGTYPKTKFLRLIEALAVFDETIDTQRKNMRNRITPKANSELSLAWDSWCNYWLLDGNCSSEKSSSRISTQDRLSKGQRDFIFQGVVRLLLHASYSEKVEMEARNDLRSLRKVLTSGDYRFTTAMMLRTVENVYLRDKLYEETLLQMSYMLSHQTSQPEESEFLYESVLRSVAEGSNWKAEQVNNLLSFCVSVMSKWDSLPGWEIHVAYSIALLKTLLSHFSSSISMRSRVFLATRNVNSLPPLTKLTSETIKNLLIVLENYPCFRDLAVAQVYNWSDKEHRSCNGVLLRLLRTALNPTISNKNNRPGSEEKLLERFVKASLKSKTMWISNAFNEEDRDNLHALHSIARMIARARKPCELFFECLFRTGSFSRNSWILLGTTLESSQLVDTGPEVTNQEFGRLLGLIVKYINGFSEFQNGYPELASLQVLESVTRHLRLRKFSFYDISSSIGHDMAFLCKNLTECAQSRCSLLFSVAEPPMESFCSTNTTDLCYTASLLACHAEILKLDLSLEDSAKDTLVKLSINDGQFIRYCLATHGIYKSQDDGFPRMKDLVIQLMSTVKAALPWLTHLRCDDDLARSLFCIQKIMSPQMLHIASGRNERHSSVRECFNMLSNYIRANDLVKKFSSPLETTISTGVEAGTTLNAFPKALLEEAADYVLQSSYQSKDTINLRDNGSAKNLDPFFVLSTFLQGCRQALLQPQAPVLDLHRISRDGILALALTGTAATDQVLRTLSLACLQAFATVVGPTTGVSPGSASGLYKDRRQLAFLLELLRNSITDPLTEVLPLFAVWFRTASRIVLSPGHTANKLVTTLLLRAPCLDVSDCYGLSHFLNCETSGSELQAIRLLAFDIIQKGVHSQRDLSVIRRRRVFDKVFMFAASAMGFDSSVRIAALKALEAILKRDESLDVTDELVGGHGIITWLASDAKYMGETTEELFIKLSIMRSAADGFVRRRYQTYASVLAEALTLFTVSRLKPTITTGRDEQITARIAECGTSIARISPNKRRVFRINFTDLWIDYKSKNVISFPAKRDFICCICRQRDTVRRPEVLEMLLEHLTHESEHRNGAASDLECWTDDVSMIHMFVADCILAVRGEAKKDNIFTSELSNLLAMCLYNRPTVWLLLAAVAALDLCGSLSDKVIACTDKIPAFVPQELKPHLEEQFCPTVEEMRLTVVEELLALGDKLVHRPSETNIFNGEAERYHTANGIH